MPVPSFPIALSHIVAEFGHDGTPQLSDYYRGGPRVPNNAFNAAISTSPAGLALSQFYGARATVPHSVGKSGDAYGDCWAFSPSSSCFASTNAVTAIVSNGVGPFTYSWSLISGPSVTVSAPTSATTSFSASAGAMPGGNVLSSVFRCTVTDTGNGGVTAYVDVTVALVYYWSDGS